MIVSSRNEGRAIRHAYGSTQIGHQLTKISNRPRERCQVPRSVRRKAAPSHPATACARVHRRLPFSSRSLIDQFDPQGGVEMELAQTMVAHSLADKPSSNFRRTGRGPIWPPAACIHLVPPVPLSRPLRHFAFFTWVRFVARPLPFGRGVTAMETPVNRKEDPEIEKRPPTASVISGRDPPQINALFCRPAVRSRNTGRYTPRP